MLRAGDEQQRKIEDVASDLSCFAAKVLAASPATLLAEVIREDLQNLVKALSPESVNSVDLGVVVAQVRKSDMLKGFRVFDCGSKLLALADQAIEKLQSCQEHVHKFQGFLKEVATTMDSIATGDSVEAALKVVETFKALSGQISGWLQLFGKDTLLAKCVAAETGFGLQEL